MTSAEKNKTYTEEWKLLELQIYMLEKVKF